MNLPKWYCDDSFLKEINSKLYPPILITGPSGAGKTTYAGSLESISDKYEIITNYTTRARRKSDPVGHFHYLNEQEFIELFNAKKFFISRSKPAKNYGYLKDEYSNIIKKQKHPVFMFRSSGAQFFFKLGIPFICFLIEASPDQIFEHSTANPKPTLETTKKNIKQNSNLYDQLILAGVPTLKIHNKYGGMRLIQENLDLMEGFIQQSV